MFTTKNLIPNLVKYLGTNKRNLKEICFFNAITKEEKDTVQKLGVKVSMFTEALNFQKVLAPPKLTLDSELTYSFTSGTTGVPKGVVYTHRMIISQLHSL